MSPINSRDSPPDGMPHSFPIGFKNAGFVPTNEDVTMPESIMNGNNEGMTVCKHIRMASAAPETPVFGSRISIVISSDANRPVNIFLFPMLSPQKKLCTYWQVHPIILIDFSEKELIEWVGRICGSEFQAIFHRRLF